MKKIALILLLLSGLAALAQINFNGLNPFKLGRSAGKMVKGAGGIGLKEEMAIGGSVAVEIVARFGGLVRDETITRHVNLVGKSLAHYCDRPELQYRFGVLNSPTVNAFSAPGGYIFITRGLYDMVENDDQLAGVLAHEIAHVTERHALKIIARGEFMEGMVGVASEAGGAAAKRDFTQFSQGINKITSTLFEKGFDSKTEYEADKTGSQLAAGNGYARGGLKQCLESLEKRETKKSATFSTHPPLKQRIAKLDK